MRERNLRFHLMTAVAVFYLAVKLQVRGGELGVLCLAVGMVIAMELVNSSIEAVVDLLSPEEHPLAKIAKDAAAGGVLVSAIGSVGVGIAVLWRPEELVLLVKMALASPVRMMGYAGFLIGAIWFIFALPEKQSS